MEPEHFGTDEPLTPAERQFLIDSGAPPDSFDPERKRAARAALRRRAQETRRRASPELTTRQVAQLLGSTEQEVRQCAESLELYAFMVDGGLRFPEWQFPHAQVLPGLRDVLRALGEGMHPYSVEGLLADVPHEELDDLTAVEWLARGGSTAPVVDLVVGHGYGM